ncbi:MAG: hypothetical protein IJ770_04650 [Alphaproteobacteria bacterium]|nr:hypothetical protein [Alphaproteobacteria bacterium]
MSDEQLNQAFSKEELGFLENVAKPEIQPTEEEKKLLVDKDLVLIEDKADVFGYQHKDGTRVLTRCVNVYEDPVTGGYEDGEEILESSGIVLYGDKIRAVALIKGENYVRLAFKHTFKIDDFESVNLNISIGKLGEDNSRASLDFIDEYFHRYEEDVDYWEYDNGSMIDAEIHNILGKENPALRDVFRQYIPEGVDIANTLTRHRENLNTMKDATQEQINQAVFMKALDKWKNTK